MRRVGSREQHYVVMNQDGKVFSGILGGQFQYSEDWSKAKSIEMFNVIKEHTKNPTNEKLARNWNGGYKGYKCGCTLQYWEKVKNQITIK